MTGLRQAAEARARWLMELTDRLHEDRRVVGAWLVGSTGEGRHDVWSDLDLVVAVETSEHLPDPVAWVNAVSTGEPLFTVTVPRNAPANGNYLGICIEVAGLPVWTDWYLWPAATAVVPAGATVVVERPTVALRRSDEPFMVLLDRHRTAATAKADRSDPRFRLLTVMLGAKYLARGDSVRLDHMLALLGADETGTAPAATVLRQALRTVHQPALSHAVTRVSALLDLACRP